MRFITTILLSILFIHPTCWSQQQTLLKVAYVNPSKVSGLNSSTKSQLDAKLKTFSEKNSIDLILENAVSVNPDLDITEHFNSINARGIEVKFENPSQEGKQFINVTFVNAERLQNLLGNKTDQQKQTSIPFLNQKIKDFSEQNNIHLVFQKAVYLAKELDCTDHLFHFIKNGKNDPLSHRAGYISSSINTFKFVNASKLLKELPSAKEAENRLAQQFRIREDQIRNLQKNNSEEFFKARDAFQKDLTAAKQNEFNLIVKQINADINNYRIRSNLQFVIQEAIFVAPVLDVTDAILSISNK